MDQDFVRVYWSRMFLQPTAQISGEVISNRLMRLTGVDRVSQVYVIPLGRLIHTAGLDISTKDRKYVIITTGHRVACVHAAIYMYVFSVTKIIHSINVRVIQKTSGANAI